MSKPCVLVPIDPGKLACAAAVFSPYLGGHTLRAVYYGLDPKALERLVDAHRCQHPACPAECVLEVPQVYSRSTSKGDPNDLVAIAVEGGRMCSPYRTTYVKPAAWKGQVPKHIHHMRIRKILSGEEAAIIDSYPILASKRHNLLDAVGLGLRTLGRM